MAEITPPPTNRSSFSSAIPDHLLSIVFPFCITIIAIFFLCFFVGTDNIKQFGSFGLCGLGAFCLYQNASKGGGAFTRWTFGFTEWVILALLSHSLYFAVVINWIK